MTRVGIVGMWHETNTYSSRSPTLDEFAAFELHAGDAIVERHAGTKSVIAGFCEASGYDLVPVFSAGAWPAGPASRGTAEELLARLRRELEAVGPLDGVLLNLHGAMVAEGRPDMEHDTVAAVRGVVGDAPVAAVLDLHGNPSQAFTEACDVVIGYDTYPHVDMWERGCEAAGLLAERLDGKPLRTYVAKVPLLSCPLAQGTSQEPMRGLQARAWRRAADAGVERVCLLPGFPYSDVPRAGFSVLVVAKDRSAAGDVARETALDVEAHREDFVVSRDDPETAVRRALRATAKPVVLADLADNIGGGGPGDGTVLLAALLAEGADGAVVLIADAEVAALAGRIGPGGSIETVVGGKTDRLHGDPVPIRGRVERVTDGRYRSGGSWMTGQTFSMGTTAVVQVDGVTLVVMERATPPFHGEQLSSVGIDASAASVVVVKGMLAWRAAYGDVAAEAIEVATPGVCPVDPSVLPRTTAPARSGGR